MLRIEFKTQEEENSFLAFIKNQKGIDLEITKELNKSKEKVQMQLTVDQEEQFNRMVKCIMSQGDIDCLTDLISDEDKKRFIEDWNNEN